jgi:hypothetical protein
MNSKKEVLAASILAIGLAVGLGALSYGLFSETPTALKLESAIDVFTQKGGLGANTNGGGFEPFDNVSVYAYLTHGGAKLKNQPVTFTIEGPNNTQIIRTEATNDIGIAAIDLYLLPSEGHTIGTWHVFANATVDDEAVDDTVGLQCESQSARIYVFYERNGVPSTSFLPNETVFIEAQLSYKNASIAGTPVAFEVIAPDSTVFLLQTVTTSSLGTANVTFRIPWPSDLSTGIWQVIATSEVYGQTLNATTHLQCFLLSPVLDVFTQKGGAGQNKPGGTFALNETVGLYAEIRDALNQTAPNQLIMFSIKNPNGTTEYLAPMTNSSGIASVSFRIPPDPLYVGTFEGYASTAYFDTVLLDTVTFIVK